ncbi:MAG TPA: HNH endonuclease signature motif containing protein [Polyangiaceae bacterium]|nr:HNH endonuclease signature motif containing protein [Polyangiaceae bacterium]
MGQHEYRLKALADNELLAGLSSVVGRRNQVTAEFLAYLAELDERQLFLDLGFASLFEYCVETLGLCESTAGRHIAAARVCRNHPEVFARVASGALHASALSLLRKHLTPENATELFELCAHRSARKVEELLAARFPRPDVRDLVRRLTRFAIPGGVPAQAGLTLDAERVSETAPAEVPPRAPTAPQQTAFVESRPREPSTALGALGAAEAPKPGRLEPLSADRYGVHFTADGEFRELLERVRGLAGHRLPNGDLMTLLKHGLEAYERELTKERFAVGRKPRRSRGVAPAPCAPRAPSGADLSGTDLREPELSTPDPSNLVTQSTPNPNPNPNASSNPKRHCPAAVARAVFLRDGQQCSYVSPDGRRCSARRCLELDHVNPWSVGGDSTVENLRLRCRAHNQRYARQYYGKSRVEAAVLNARRRAAAERPGQE